MENQIVFPVVVTMVVMAVVISILVEWLPSQRKCKDWLETRKGRKSGKQMEFIREFIDAIKDFKYRHSKRRIENQAKTEVEFKERTGFDWNDPIFKVYGWISNSYLTTPDGEGYYTKRGTGEAYRPINGKMIRYNP